MEQPFHDRRDAGKHLAEALEPYRSDPPPVILALPRGGVPVAFEVARALNAPLDVFVVRKLGFPGNEEFAMGAIASGGAMVLNNQLVSQAKISNQVIEEITLRERRELARREKLYRGHHPPMNLRNRTVILVDDGLATGSTMQAAVKAVRKLEPSRVVIGVPVAASEACAAFRSEVDGMVCARVPESFHSVGQWYEDFYQTSDHEVRFLLEESRRVIH